MPYILSPEQNLVFDALRNQSSSDIKYFDSFTAFQTMSLAIIDAIENGQKVLIHIPQAEKNRDELLDLLNQSGLGELVIDINDRGKIPEVDIIKLRAALKRQVDTASIIENAFAQKNVNFFTSRIEAYYNTLGTKILSDVPFRDFVASYIYNNHEDRSTTFYLSTDPVFEYTSTEFYRLKSEIKTAAQLYQNQYDLLDTMSLVNESIWGLDELKFNTQISSLSSLKNRALKMKADFANAYTHLSNQANQSITDKISSFQLKIQETEQKITSIHINEVYSTKEIDSSFYLFGRKKTNKTDPYVEAYDDLSSTIKELSSDWFDQLDAPFTEDINFEYISEFIQRTKVGLSTFGQITKSSQSNSLHRINRINTDSAEVLRLDSELSEIISEIEHSDTYTRSFVNNTLSFLKQKELAIEICSYLQQCETILKVESQFVEWKRFNINSSSLLKDILSQCKMISKEHWEDCTEQWYFSQMIQNLMGDNTVSKSVLEDLSRSLDTMKNSRVPALINKVHNTRVSKVEELKANSKELYNTLFKKKTLPSTSWHDLSLMNRPFLVDFFPIHTTNQLSNISDYDLVISWSQKEDTEDNDSPSNIHHISTIKSEDLEDIPNSKSIFLYLNSYNYSQPLKQLTSTERLKASKKLAKFILSLNQNVKIYQTKTANIISLLPTNDDLYLEQLLEPQGLKTIDTNGVLYDRLTESILFTERPPFLIVKDEMINPDFVNNIQWQIKLVEIFKEAGYNIHSINTSDQLIDNKNVFAKLMYHLNGTESKAIKTDDLTEVEVITNQESLT